MKLFYNPLSPNTRRVRLTAAVLGMALDEHKLDFTKGEHKTPEYLALNPNGAVPTLVDGDYVLTESRAIMQYLATRKPEAGLLPLDEKTRADVTRWQFWDASHFGPHLAAVTFEKFFKPMMRGGDPDTRKIEEALSQVRRFGAVLDKRLEGRTYVVGNALTIADLSLASSLMYAKQTEIPLAEFPSIQAWFSRISELEAWKKTSA
jgi:glutathione S-transferase